MRGGLDGPERIQGPLSGLRLPRGRQIFEAFGPGEGLLPGFDGKGLLPEEPGIEAQRGRILGQDRGHQRIIPRVQVPNLKDGGQFLLIRPGQHLLQDVPGELPFPGRKDRPARQQDLSDLEEDLAVVPGQERGFLVFLEIADGRGEGKIGHIEKGLGELEMGLQGSGIETEGTFEAREAPPEIDVAAADVPEVLGAPLKPGLGELEMDETVPGEKTVGLLEQADPRRGIAGHGHRPVIEMDIRVRTDGREPEKPEGGDDERFFHGTSLCLSVERRDEGQGQDDREEEHVGGDVEVEVRQAMDQDDDERDGPAEGDPLDVRVPPLAPDKEGRNTDGEDRPEKEDETDRPELRQVFEVIVMGMGQEQFRPGGLSKAG